MAGMVEQGIGYSTKPLVGFMKRKINPTKSVFFAN